MSIPHWVNNQGEGARLAGLWLVLDVGEALTLVTLLDKLHCILSYSWLVVSMSQGFLSQASSPQVVPIDSFMDLSKCIVSFRRPEVLE